MILVFSIEVSLSILVELLIAFGKFMIAIIAINAVPIKKNAGINLFPVDVCNEVMIRGAPPPKMAVETL